MPGGVSFRPVPPAPADSLTIVVTRPFTATIEVPQVRINGSVVTLRWGHNVLHAHRGIHHIEAFVKAMTEVGHAWITVDNTHTSAPAVYYSPPANAFSPGVIGFRPAPTPGASQSKTMLGIAIVLPVLVILAMLAFLVLVLVLLV